MSRFYVGSFEDTAVTSPQPSDFLTFRLGMVFFWKWLVGAGRAALGGYKRH